MRVVWPPRFPLLLLVLVAGCSDVPTLPRTGTENDLFGPSELRFHSFTQVKDFTADDTIDGIDAQVELLDQFGDPTKGSGSFIFELFEYRKGNPDMRGIRLAYWPATLVTLDAQRLHWNKITRTYGFRLYPDEKGYPPISDARSYVLTAQYQAAGGGRLTAHTVLLAKEEEPPSATQPSTRPAATQPVVAQPTSRPHGP